MDAFLPGMKAAQTEGRDALIEQKLADLIDALPQELRDFILAKLEESETGTMPMPPMDPMPPMMPPTPMR